MSANEFQHITPLGEKIRHAAYRFLDARMLNEARKEGIDHKRIAIVCRRGHGFSDNPKYLVEALERLYPQTYDFVVLAFNEPEDLANYIRFVPADSRQALYELARAKFWIADVRTNWPIDKTPEQYYLQTWHASVGPKLIEARAEDKISPGYIEMAKRDGAFTSFMFTNVNIYEKSYANDFWQNGPVVRSGVPRNRPLIHYNQEQALHTRKKLGILPSNGLLLYAPTFRNAAIFDAHALDMWLCKNALEERFGCPFSIAFRLHPEVAQEAVPSFLDGFIDVTHYPDVQELLCATDVLISDYSSILEDFLMLGRPCFTFAPDIEAYEQERGFYYPLQTRPAPFAKTEKALLDNIANYDNELFLVRRNEFFQLLDFTDDGNGDKTVACIIHELMLHGGTPQDAINHCRANGIFTVVDAIHGKASPTQAPLGPLKL